MSKQERIQEVNALVQAISSRGTNLFLDVPTGKVSYFFLSEKGQIFFFDAISARNIYTAYKGPWSYFAQGVEVREFALALVNYIRNGGAVDLDMICPLNSDGTNRWGYSLADAQALRDEVKGMAMFSATAAAPVDKEAARNLKLERLAHVNALTKSISSYGRRFFYNERIDYVAYMTMDERGKLWWHDDYSLKRIYIAHKGEWRGFSHGGTLRWLVEAMAVYVREGHTMHPDIICQPRSDGSNIWGYSKEQAELLRNEVRDMPIFFEVKKDEKEQHEAA